MATSKPRITITLEPRTYDVLSRMARVGDESMSQIVTSLIDLAVPSFERAVVLMERAAVAPDEVKDGLRAALHRADRAVLPRLLAAAEQGEMFLGDVESEVFPEGPVRSGGGQEVGAGAGGRAAPADQPPAPKRRKGAASPPVPVTRGVGTPGEGRQAKAKKGRGRAA
jgi:hypothetical protein